MPNHVGGPVTAPGEPSVLLGGRAAARYSDMAACHGAVDAINDGNATVFIGKLPASRKVDGTEHKGLVVTGFDRVLLGETPAGVKMIRRGKMLVIVDSRTHTIRIVGVQEFKGDGASEEYVKKATDCINETWSGDTTLNGEPYKVDCMVSGRRTGSTADPLANEINVKKTTDSPWVTGDKDPSWQSLNGDGPGYQHNTDADGLLTPAHEFGHSMGIDDEYKEGPKVNGHRTITQTGPDGGLMGHVGPGSKPTPDNFGELVNGKKKK
jgi:uncharacterized Zn-binding protein involved in type VI secretion